MSASAVSSNLPSTGPMTNGQVLPPKILSELQASSTSVDEGEPIQLIVQVSRESDVTVDWFKDGKPLTAGSRFDTSIDRGFASLEIYYTYPEDSGAYCCIIRNQGGEARSNVVEITVKPEEGTMQEIVNANDLEDANAAFQDTRELERDARMMPKTAPAFVGPLTVTSAQVVEGDGVRFETTLNPASDNTLQVEWFKDEKPVGTGSRFNAVFDRGFCILEIAYCFQDDSGTYVCRAKNALGQGESNPVEFVCSPEDRVVTRSILDEVSIQHLKALDEPGEEFSTVTNEITESVPPSFTGSLEPATAEIMEDEEIVFHCTANNGSGNLTEVEWRKDGTVVQYGSRVTGLHAPEE